MSEKLIYYIQLDYMQIDYMNKAEKFQKDIQTNFFKKKDLSYLQNRDHVSYISK